MTNGIKGMEETTEKQSDRSIESDILVEPVIEIEQYSGIEEIFRESEQSVLDYFISEEMKNQKIEEKYEFPAVVKRKLIFTLIFAILSFILLSTYFFHFRYNFWWLEIINLAVYLLVMKKYNTLVYLRREITARPDEEIPYIISSLYAGAEDHKGRQMLGVAMLVAAVVLPFLIFMKPHMLYESSGEDYYVRFYTRGLIQPSEIEVPENYKEGKVIGIRGNVFANLQGVNTIVLPEEMEAIRGYAFANSKDLRKIKMPKTLHYLGGSAFLGCRLLFKMEIPEGITEIKGETFEDCQYLEKVVIPEGVTRIGGHAFCDCSSLKEVIVPSTVNEIGSSAFRRCVSLEKVEIPTGTWIDERAFKESPTKICYQ